MIRRTAMLLAPLALSACHGAASSASSATPDLRPADGAAIDPTTGLPTRVVHEPSGITLVLVPAGELRMGHGETEHRRVVRKPFYLGETEVTHGQFRRFADAAGYRTDAERGTPHAGHGVGSFAHLPGGARAWSEEACWQVPFPNLGHPPVRDDDPVVHVSWNDATAFADHFGLRLPTEVEWEHAARAGTATLYPWGDDPAGGAGFANLADLAHRRRFPSANVWFPFDDCAEVLSPAGAYRPNAWGLEDMIGNVEEWVRDAYAGYPPDGTDESAVEGGSARVMRGRSWLDGNGPGMNRAALEPAARRDFIGFRVARSVEP